MNPVAAIGHPAGDVFYAIPNQTCKWRVDTFFTKEPDTVAWIAEFNPGDVFFDVGANVGMYAVWAAKTAGTRVFAFEPESQNFAILNQNILLNQCDVMAYPVALTNVTKIGLGPLFVSQFSPGGSCHAFGEKINFRGEKFRPVFRQGAVCIALDDLVISGAVPQPDYVKIDVDGFEHKVVSGGLCIRGCRGALVEINPALDAHQRLIGRFGDWGFWFDKDQAEKSRRKTGPFAGVGNVIFRR